MGNYNDFKKCIELCDACAAACYNCATECTKEKNVNAMAKCIQLDMECAAICNAASALMSQGSDKAYAICSVCEDICRACGNECSKFNSFHCQQCADICRQCAEECGKMAA